MRNHHTLLVSSLLAERSKALAVVYYASILADSHTGPFVNFGRGQKVLPALPWLLQISVVGLGLYSWIERP